MTVQHNIEAKRTKLKEQYSFFQKEVEQALCTPTERH